MIALSDLFEVEHERRQSRSRIQKRYDEARCIDPERFKLFEELCKLFIGMYSTEGMFSPLEFSKNLAMSNSAFNCNMQQDAHEFLNHLLNYVSDVMVHLESSKDDGKVEKSKKVSETRKSFVQDIFQGEIVYETECMRCETISSRKENFLDLSIGIYDHTSITYCLKEFASTEKLIKSNKYLCDTCKCPQEALRKVSVSSFPETLVIHMKRFEFTGESQSFRKLCHRVSFPSNLKPYSITGNTIDDSMYELSAVIVHIGGSMSNGHYVCMLKKHGIWMLCDDHRVELVTEDTLRTCFGKNKSANHQDGYLLFYDKV